MKAIYKHIAFAALALSVAACTQEEDFSLTYQNDPDAVRITAQVGIDEVTGGFTRSNPTGDENEQTQFNKGDQIAVAAVTQAAVVYTYDGSDWNPETEKYLKWEDESMEVTAYYPVTEGTSATTFTVPEDQTLSIELADYMTYNYGVNKGDNKCIDLTMERKMVRIVVDNITFNGQFDTAYDVTAVTVHGNTKGYADYEVQTGNISVQALKHSNGKFYALLSPTTESADDYFITLTVQNSSDASESYELKVKGIPATTAGNSYDLSLTVGKGMASIGNISVTPWESGSITGGEATEILKATCVIDGTTAILTVPANADETSIDQAIESLTSATGLATVIVNGLLTAHQQAALATALTDYAGGLIFNDMTLAELSNDIKSLPNAVVVDSEDKFAKTTEESVTVADYQTHKLTTTEQGTNYIYTGGASDDRAWASIIVESGVHNITLNNCFLDGYDDAAPIEIHPGAIAYITVTGTNKMQNMNGGYAGIAVFEGGHLVITTASEGTLETVGDRAGAGIGGGQWNSINESNTDYTYCSSGKVTINGGTIKATGGDGSAGIGSAGTTASAFVGGYTCGDITINGGNVTAQGGTDAAGIGGGRVCPGANVIINGGTVTAQGGENGEGIGKGYNGGHSGTLIIGVNADVTSNGQTMSPTE